MKKCILCKSNRLPEVYSPLGTRRGHRVFCCVFCGCLQTHPRNIPGDGVPRISSRADYGNLRIGKQQRITAAMRIISHVFGNNRPRRILDVGASRGRLVGVVSGWASEVGIVALEPDLSVTGWWLDVPESIAPCSAPIEDTVLSSESFGLICLLHTLEHLPDPLAVLRKLEAALTPDGYLFVEVPNILGLMKLPDIVEELFLDKHLTHLTPITLTMMLQAARLGKIAFWRDGRENITVMVQKSKPIVPTGDKHEPIEAAEMVKAYFLRLEDNLNDLAMTAAKLNRLARKQPTVASGAGRILDALFRAGLDPAYLEGVLDPAVPLDEVRGLPVFRPGDLPSDLEPGLVIVCGRTEADRMEAEARGLFAGVKVVRWNDV